jgi:hypothetical protein
LLLPLLLLLPLPLPLPLLFPFSRHPRRASAFLPRLAPRPSIPPLALWPLGPEPLAPEPALPPPHKRPKLTIATNHSASSSRERTGKWRKRGVGDKPTFYLLSKPC